MSSYIVKLNFTEGINSYDIPHVQSLSDPKEGIKATVIEGNRGSGSIVIPGGKKSQEIRVRGILLADDYVALTTLIEDLKTKVNTNVATLTLKYWTGSVWQNVWQYSVRRITEINFPESLRTDYQEYEISFLIISYS